jgi:glycosyltransferase involved in cell wall biosynthesis
MLPNWITKNIGGSEIQCYIMTESLIQKGWSIEVITSFQHSKNQSFRMKYFNKKIHYIYFRSTVSTLINLIKLVIIIKSIKSRFIYVRTDARLFQIAASISSKLFKIKVIYAIASDEELVKKSFWTLTRKNRKNPFTKPFYLIESIFVDFLFGRFNYNVDKIIVQTDNQKKKLLQDYNLHSIKIQNSIFTGKEVHFQNKKDIILWIGYLRPIKQPEVLFELSKILKLKSWRIVVIGNTTQYTEVIDIYKDHISFIGELSLEQTEKWLQNSKILINTSKNEGFPNAFMQAWYNKVYVVSLCVDPDGLLTREKLGFFSENSIELMSSHIQSIINNENNINKIINTAQLYCKKNFNIEKNIKKFESILNEI